MEVADQVAATRGEATSRLRMSMFWILEKLNFLSLTVMARVPPSLVDRLLALMDETRPDPNKEQAMFVLDNIIQSHYKRFDEHFPDDAPQYALPPGTLDVLVSPRGLAIFAGLIRRGSCEMVSSMLSVLDEPGTGSRSSRPLLPSHRRLRRRRRHPRGGLPGRRGGTGLPGAHPQPTRGDAHP